MTDNPDIGTALADAAERAGVGVTIPAAGTVVARARQRRRRHRATVALGTLAALIAIGGAVAVITAPSKPKVVRVTQPATTPETAPATTIRGTDAALAWSQSPVPNIGEGAKLLALDDGQLILFAGRTGTTLTVATREPNATVWSVLGELEVADPAIEGAAFTARNIVAVTASGDTVVVTRDTTGTVTKAAPEPPVRQRDVVRALIRVDDTIIDTGTMAQWSDDAALWSDLPSPPPSSYRRAGAAVDGDLLLAGFGVEAAMYSLAADTWTAAGRPSSSGLAGEPALLVSWSRHVLIDEFGSTAELSAATKRWTTKPVPPIDDELGPCLPQAVTGDIAALMCGQLIVLDDQDVWHTAALPANVSATNTSAVIVDDTVLVLDHERDAMWSLPLDRLLDP